MAPRPQGILRGGIWILGGRAFAAAGAIFMNALIARLIPADAFGTYVLASSLTFFGATFACFGLHRASIRLIANFKAREQHGEAATVILLTVLVGLFVSVAIGGLLFIVLGDWLAHTVFETPLLATIPIVLTVLLVLRTLQALLTALMVGVKDMRGAALVDGALPMAFTIAGLIVYALLATNPGFRGLMTIIAAGTAGGVIFALVFVASSLRALGKPRRIGTGLFVGTTFPLFVATTTFLGASEAHIWLLGAMSSEEDVALFGAAQRLVKFISFPLFIINAVLPPYVASAFAEGRNERLQQLLQAAATVCALPSLIVVVVLVAAPAGAMGVVFGPYYAAGATALVILSVSHGINVATGSPRILLSMSDRQSQLMYISLLTGATGVLLSAVLIPRYGLTGAAIGAGASMILQNLVMWGYARFRLRLKTEMSLASAPFIYREVRARIAAARRGS